MTDWIDKMMAPLSEGTAPVPEECFEALEKAYVHRVRVRTWRRILIGTTAAALLLLPVLTPVLRRTGQMQDSPGDTSSQLAELAAAATETMPAPALSAPEREPVSPGGKVIDPAPPAFKPSASPAPASVSASATVISPVPGPKAPVPGSKAPVAVPKTSVPTEDEAFPVKEQTVPVVWADPVPVRKHRSHLSVGLLSSTNMSKREQTVGTVRYCHYAPVSLGVRLDWLRGSRWRLSSGVEMNWYSSDFIQGAGKAVELYEQNVAYLGVPLRVDRVWPFASGHGAFYAGLGGLVEKGLYGSSGSRRLTPDGWGFSAVGAVGVQYNLLSGIGFYFEPSLARTLIAPSGRTPAAFTTYRSNNPLQFALYAGIRFLL